VLPRLTHLYLKDFYSRSQARWPTAGRQWITQSGTLQILEIDIGFFSSHFEELLRASPLLAQLSVLEGVFSASCLEGIASGALIPRVRKLSCMVDTLNCLHAHLDMLERRKADSSHAVHIAEVTFRTVVGVQESELSRSARYREMVTLGWKISII